MNMRLVTPILIPSWCSPSWKSDIAFGYRRLRIGRIPGYLDIASRNVVSLRVVPPYYGRVTVDVKVALALFSVETVKVITTCIPGFPAVDEKVNVRFMALPFGKFCAMTIGTPGRLANPSFAVVSST